MTRIAFVDNQRENLAAVGAILAAESYHVDTFRDGQFALDSFQRRMPDLVVINLPTSKIDGVSLIEHIRAHSIIPVVLLSTARDEIDEIMGLRYGADDYIHMPVSPRLLAERIMALLRRHATLLSYGKTPEATQKVLNCGPLVLDPSRHNVCWKGRYVTLTSTEFQMLHALVRRPGFVKTRDQLMSACYPDEVYVDDRTIDSHIKRIRNKLRTVDAEFASIETLYGVGYRFVPSSERALELADPEDSRAMVNHDAAEPAGVSTLRRTAAWQAEPAVYELGSRIDAARASNAQPGAKPSMPKIHMALRARS